MPHAKTELDRPRSLSMPSRKAGPNSPNSKGFNPTGPLAVKVQEPRSGKSSPRKKKETELEFTRRLLRENPRGIKGLAYVLLEIRRAISEGIIKPKIDGDAKKFKNINKFAAMMNKAASTRLK